MPVGEAELFSVNGPQCKGPPPSSGGQSGGIITQGASCKEIGVEQELYIVGDLKRE